MNTTASEPRDRAHREGDGVHVHLHWHPDTNALTVSVEDGRAGDHSQPDRALDAFDHPFADAA